MQLSGSRVRVPRLAPRIDVIDVRSVRADALRARWLLDARYGCKQEATALLVEWVQTVGAAAGIAPGSARISTGALGAPESRLELEVAFETMADWEAFLARVPAPQHRAWSQRVQGMVVDGSTKWEVFRVVDVPATNAGAVGAAAPVAAAAAPPAASPWGATTGSGSGGRIVIADKVSDEDAALWAQQQRQAAGGGGSSSDSGDRPGDGAGDGEVTLDWKGDPIKFSPGDKLPFKFL